MNKPSLIQKMYSGQMISLPIPTKFLKNWSLQSYFHYSRMHKRKFCHKSFTFKLYVCVCVEWGCGVVSVHVTVMPIGTEEGVGCSGTGS